MQRGRGEGNRGVRGGGLIREWVSVWKELEGGGMREVVGGGLQVSLRGYLCAGTTQSVQSSLLKVIFSLCVTKVDIRYL